MRRLATTLFVAVGVSWIGGCDEEQDESRPQVQSARPAALANEFFTSKRIVKKGTPAALTFKRPIDLGFPQQHGTVTVIWNAGCRTFDGDVRVDDSRLVIGELSSERENCQEALDDQDEWLRRFFQSDPAWDLVGHQLSLSNQGTRIDLLRQRE